MAWVRFAHDLAAAHSIEVEMNRLEPISPRTRFRVGTQTGDMIDGQGTDGLPAAFEFTRHFVLTWPDDGDPGVPDDYRGDIHDPSYGVQVSAEGGTAESAYHEAIRLYEIDCIYQYLDGQGWDDDAPERELEPGAL
jgi:hypothetical protein